MKDSAQKTNWKASNLRITIFPEQPFINEPKSFWPNVPEMELEKQSMQTKTTESILEGSYKDKKISIIFLPLRVDLVISAPLQPSQFIDSFPSVGSLEQASDEFNRIVGNWIKQISITKTKRVAFGAETISKILSLEEGYKQISRYLPFTVSTKDSSDFRLQLNKPKRSKVIKDLMINRLTTWDVVKTNLSLSRTAQPDAIYAYPPLFFCHLILDINTAQEYKGTFTKDESIKIFAELISYGKEISTTGVK